MVITSRAFKEICYDIAIKFEYDKGAQVTQKPFLGHPPQGIINIRFNNSDLTHTKAKITSSQQRWPMMITNIHILCSRNLPLLAPAGAAHLVM